ncbi:MAG: universal stress protein [Alphaproteobacteria bacterium]|jgi:nucleotide-binding universal stress UspA family protein|nr:universal stress protein [Rhodospirillaceae bacterium]MDP6021335.1 universal stress protein [Alphaproteobacteria bacterium]MDP6256013.1 universal stress protein [Alphaproteobacteria bacterium]MDP7227271.1 universal stress protein [Alphaproteobacteria bacterium]MDP7461336.1 universal stress protein [Alphaproteobacteria bacterium]|tara:strand:- start:2246 stop:2737 length:492 start_codon:yes stop_codon:yes gene_type:complete
MMEELQQGTLTRRKFLCVVDDSPECRLALRFAFRRAARTGGGVILLYVIEPADFQHWMAVENLMREEAREAAEEVLQTLADEVNEWSGIMPEFSIREGRKQDEVLALLEEEPEIRLLVLGASAEKDGPGPLVTALAGPLSANMRVPVTVVPGNLNIQQIDEIT